jgi:hypothetical protein
MFDRSFQDSFHVLAGVSERVGVPGFCNRFCQELYSINRVSYASNLLTPLYARKSSDARSSEAICSVLKRELLQTLSKNNEIIHSKAK